MKNINKKALFLDRDGVINVDFGYVHSVNTFVFNEGIFKFAERAIQQGLEIFVITNQSGIGRGYYSESDFLRLSSWMSKRFEENKAPISEIYYCPHYQAMRRDISDTPCECRKPEPGLILKAAAENLIDLAQSTLVGDKESDLEAGYRAGVGKLIYIGDGPTKLATHSFRTVRELAESDYEF